MTARTWTFAAAQRWLAGRLNRTTVLRAAEIALDPAWEPRARAQAFFSARVSEASVLDSLRQQSDAYSRGEIDLATARLRLKTALVAQGFQADDVGMTDTPPPGVTEDDWKARKDITNLASTRRTDLILVQNQRMAAAVARREVSLAGPVAQRWPYWRYIARGDARVRPTHAALDGMVLPKTDPFWATHTPPWEYNCRCDIEDADEDDARRAGGVARAITRDNPDGTQTATVATPGGGVVNVLPESSFTFRIDSLDNPDWNAIPDPALRERARRNRPA